LANNDWLVKPEEIDELHDQPPTYEDLQRQISYLMAKAEEDDVRKEVRRERRSSQKKLGHSNGFVKLHRLINQKAVLTQMFSTPEKCLLFDLLPFCNLESNMICDEQGIPMNQKDIIELVGHDRRYVQDTLSKLIDKGVITKVSKGKTVFYKLSKEWYGA
jgi:hypothetical protein